MSKATADERGITICFNRQDKVEAPHQDSIEAPHVNVSQNTGNPERSRDGEHNEVAWTVTSIGQSGLDDPDGDPFQNLDQEDHEETPREEAPTAAGSSTDPAGETATSASKSRKRRFDYESAKTEIKKSRKEQEDEVDKFVKQISAKNFEAPQRVELEENHEVKVQAGRKIEGAWTKIHSSHRRNLVGGIVYCRKCGAFAINKAISLSKQCQGQPPHNAARAQLKKLEEGRNPLRDKAPWPDGSEHTARFRPTPIDRY